MPQIGTYRVFVGLVGGDLIASDPHHLAVPDFMTAVELEKQLHEKMTEEWFKLKQAGRLFDLEKISEGETPSLHGGHFAVNPDHMLWVNTELISLERAGQQTPPAQST